MKTISLALALTLLTATVGPGARAADAPIAAEAPKPAEPPAEVAPPPPVAAPVPVRDDDPGDSWPTVTMDLNNPGAALQSARRPWRGPSAAESDDAPSVPADAWETQCTSPCRKRQDPSKLYRVSGRGVVASAPFELPEGTRHVDLKGRVGKKGTRIAGTVIGIVGFSNLVLNGLAYAASDSATNNNNYYGSSNNSGSTKDLFAAGMVIGGLASLIGLIMVASSSTSVHVE